MSTVDFSKPTPFLIDALLDVRKSKALDIGCGNGRNTLYLAQEGWSVHALDLDDNAISNVKNGAKEANLNVRTYQEDIRVFETDQKFDLIICLMVLHFFTKQDVKNVIKWMQGHTTLGGKNVISGFTDKNTPGTRPHLFSTDELTGYYSDWSIDTYEESDSSIQTNSAELSTYNVARLVATKI